MIHTGRQCLRHSHHAPVHVSHQRVDVVIFVWIGRCEHLIEYDAPTMLLSLLNRWRHYTHRPVSKVWT